jgi:hypothetical protein
MTGIMRLHGESGGGDAGSGKFGRWARLEQWGQGGMEVRGGTKNIKVFKDPPIEHPESISLVE